MSAPEATSPPSLLDGSVLIALIVAEHEHHVRAEAWFLEQAAVALCPVVEGALVRYLLRIGESVGTIHEALRALHAHPRVRFVPDDLSYAAVDLRPLRGHRQATDAYLVALAAQHGLEFATLDASLVASHPSAVLLPPA